jgi:hypothetical protein
VLSIPVHTPPDKLLAAAKEFAREHFALQHRYAMALHTDQGHPHVHLVVKAEHEYEPGRRLNIKKAMLRQWREDFAASLRAQGVPANATPAPERGRVVTTKKDPIHHRLRAARGVDEQLVDATAHQPKHSTFMRAKIEAVAEALKEGRFDPGAGKDKLLATRRKVVAGWLATAAALRGQGETTLAKEVEAFVKAMPSPKTEQEQIAAGLLAQLEAQRKEREARGGGDSGRTS